jgi:hypothetical protein
VDFKGVAGSSLCERVATSASGVLDMQPEGAWVSGVSKCVQLKLERVVDSSQSKSGNYGAAAVGESQAWQRRVRYRAAVVCVEPETFPELVCKRWRIPQK